MKKGCLLYCLIVFVCICSIDCGNTSYENPIIDKWWQEQKPEVEYVPIVTMIPEEIKEIIFAELSSEEIIGNVYFIGSEGVFFSSGSTVFNEINLPDDLLYPLDCHHNTGAVFQMARAFANTPELFLFIYGYCDYFSDDPIDFDYQSQLSLARAEAVREELKMMGYDVFYQDVSKWDDRIFVKSCGKKVYNLNPYSGNEWYANFSRVDMVLVRIVM
jgi:hypothetical protein